MNDIRRAMIAALAADAHYQAELERTYGKHRAGDARYKYRHDDGRVTAAAQIKLAADVDYWRAVEAARLEAKP